MAASASPTHSQHEEVNDSQNQDAKPTEPEEPQPPPEPQHSETLETPDLQNPPQLPVDNEGVHNPQQSDKDEDTLMVLDEEDHQSPQKVDHQSGTTNLSPSTLPEPIILTDDPPPPPPLTSPVNPQRRPYKRKKGAVRNPQKRKMSMKKVQNLTDILNVVPFKPKKTLDFDKHEEVLKRLGLWDFSKIEFDRNIRTDLLIQLIVNFDRHKRCSYVNELRIGVSRADLTRALKLPTSKQEKRGSGVEEVDLDSEVFSDEAIGFIEDFVLNWVVLHDDSWAMPSEIVNSIRCIKDGHPEKLDCSSLIWYMIEKEMIQGDKLVDCYYASHLQYLIRSQREEVFMAEEDGGAADHGVAEDADEIMKPDEDKQTKEGIEEKEEKEEEEEQEKKVFMAQEHNTELTLGLEEVKKDDEMMVDAAESKEEEAAEQGGSWLLDGKNELGEHFLQRCQSGDLNSCEERKPEEQEDEQIEQMEDQEQEDEQIEQMEDQEQEDEEIEEEERVEDRFNIEANDDSLDRDGLTDNFLQGVETSSHIPFGSQAELRGMSSMDLFGSRDGSFMAHGGPSFFSNGGKRVMEPEEDLHHLDGNNKRLKTDEMWDNEQKSNDFGLCIEQMQQWMEKAKIIYESKEQTYQHSQYTQQFEMDQLQQRQNILEMMIKSKDEELEKRHAEVFRLERELYLMGDLLAGYRKGLNDTRFKFSEYRKRYSVSEEPVYKDAGPGGLVLSIRELEKLRLKQEEDRMKFLILAKNLEEEFVCKFEVHHVRVSMMVDKLVLIENEVKRVKELSAKRKEIQKPWEEQKHKLEPEPEPEQEHQLEQVQVQQQEQEEQEQKREPEENQDEAPENDPIMQSVPDDAAESKEAEPGED